ncbi:MAG: lipocalin-like domain-containing protein [Gammaproteobacteria bacterium]|nr:lipocalin-like domain-containing protein [Gammaproteobacteria bacterium]
MNWILSSLMSIRWILILSLLTMFLSQTFAEQQRGETDPAYQQFIGDWALVSYITFPEDGEAQDMQYIGYLSYDKFGNMAGLGMLKDFPERASASKEPVRGGFAYWGSVSVDESGGRVIHHVEGSPMAARWVVGDNIRYYEFVDDLLKLSLKDSSNRIIATLTWRKLR